MRTISRGVTGAVLIAMSAVACTSESDTRSIAGKTPGASAPTGNAALAATLLQENDMIVIFRDQMENLRAKGDMGVRASTIARLHAPFLSSLQAAKPRTVKSFALINAFTTKLSTTEVETLSLHPDIAAVVPNRMLKLPSHKHDKGKGGGHAAAPPPANTQLCNTLEPEALQITNTAFLDLTKPQAQEVIDGQGHKVTGRGVTVAVIADGLDPTDPGFVRTDGTSVFADYQDFSGDPALTPTEGAEIYGDASSIAAQDTPNGKVLNYDLSAFVGDDYPLPKPCNIRIRGMAPEAKLVGIKVFSELGYTTTAGFIQGLEWAVVHDHVDVVNESFGYNAVYDDAQDAFALANAAAVRAGVTITTSSGDAGTAGTIGTPATAPDVIAVGATDMFRSWLQTKQGIGPFATGAIGGNIASFSSGGFAQKKGRVVDLVAPGDSGWALCSPNSTLFDGCGAPFGSSALPQYIQDFGGTSQSSPLTAGAAALVIQAYRSTHGSADPSPALVKSILTSSAHDLGATSDEQGAGQIDSLKAVNMALSIHDEQGTPAPRGAGLYSSPTSFNLTAQPNDILAREFDVTNTGTGFRTIAPKLQKLGAPVASGAKTVNINAGGTDTYIDFVGVKRAFAKATFNIPAGTDHLDAAIAFAGTPNDGSTNKIVAFGLLDPSGNQRAYSDPQGGGANYGHVDVVKPVAGQWTVVMRTTASTAATSTGFVGPVKFTWATENFVPAGLVFPPVAFAAPGQTAHFIAALESSSQAGDRAAAIRFDGDESEIPFVVRTLIGTGPHGGSFAGTFTGGNGRAGAEPTQTFAFDVPKGVGDVGFKLNVQPGYGVVAALVDPSGKTLSTGSNVDGNLAPIGTTAVQLNHADPAAGRWKVVIEDYFGAGTATSSPFTGTVEFDTIDITAPALPNNKNTKVSKAGGKVTIPVHIHNNGATSKIFFADARTKPVVQVELQPGVCSAAATAPGYCGYAILPPRVSAAAFIASSDGPIGMDAAWGVLGGPDLWAKTVATNTVAATISSTEVPWKLWYIFPGTVGPYGPAGAPTQAIATDTFVLMPDFDPSVASDTGNLWADTVTGSTTFTTGLTVDPGQTKTLHLYLTVDDSAAVGKVMKGSVSIDTFDPADPFSMGDEVVTLPYEYTVKK